MFGFLRSALSGDSSSREVEVPFVGFEVIPLLGPEGAPLEFDWRAVDVKILAGLRAMTFTDASLKAISKAALRDLWGRLFGLLRADFSRVESLRGRILVTKAELFSGLMALQGALPPEVPEEKDVLPCPEPPKPTRKRYALVAGFPEDAGADKGPLVPHGASAANSPVGSLESSDDDGEFGDGSSVFRCPATAQAKSAGVQPLARPAIPTVSAVQVRCPGCAVVWLAEMGVARPLGDLCAACGMKLTGPVASGGAPPPQMTLLASSGAGESVNPFALLSGLDAPGSTPLEDRVGWAASGRFRTFFFGPGAVGFSPGCTRPPPLRWWLASFVMRSLIWRSSLVLLRSRRISSGWPPCQLRGHGMLSFPEAWFGMQRVWP